MNISEIKSIHYYYRDLTTRTVIMEYNRISLSQLLYLCNCNGGIRHVTVITYKNRRVNLGIRNAKRMFTYGQISDF